LRGGDVTVAVGLVVVGFVVVVIVVGVDVGVVDVVEELDVEGFGGDELEVSGTPPGPAWICRIFSVVDPNTAGARETWLLSRS